MGNGKSGVNSSMYNGNNRWSRHFQSVWRIFTKCVRNKKVQEVHLETTSNIGETNAHKEYEEPGAEIQLSNNMEIVGRNETFHIGVQ